MAGEKRKKEKVEVKPPSKEELEMQSRVQQYNVNKLKLFLSEKFKLNY